MHLLNEWSIQKLTLREEIFTGIWPKFAKINSIFNPQQCRFAKINSRKIFSKALFTKINFHDIKKEIAKSNSREIFFS